MLTDTPLKTFEITVSLDAQGNLHFDPGPDVEARPGDHLVWKSTVGDLVVFIRGAEDKLQFARKSPFQRYLYCDGRDNGQGEARVRPQVKAGAEPGTYKYTLILFDDEGVKHEEDPRIVIR